MKRIPLLAFVVVGLGAVSGCAFESAWKDDGQGVEGQIVGGTKASAYEEAVLINMQDKYGNNTSACSGALIAPRVVLTAGHCVDGVPRFQIIAPYTTDGKQVGTSSKKAAYDWINVPGSSVDPDLHDVGVIILDKPMTLKKGWPIVPKARVEWGTKAMNIGRIQNGAFSSTDLFVSKARSMNNGAEHGFPYDYWADQVIQPGDSGGPVVLVGAAPHTIIAVNSGAGGDEVLARTDLLYDWIQKQVTENGGPGDPVTPPDPVTPGDADADGIADAADLCGKTPAGAPVWTTGEWIGCAAGQLRDGGGGADADGDGVPDAKDLCSKTPAGQGVWQWGDWMGCAAGQFKDK